MITSYEFTATSEDCRKIKDEVYKLTNNRFIQAKYKAIKGYVEPKKMIIGINETYGITLDLKVEALKELKAYCEGLRVRMFEGSLV